MDINSHPNIIPLQRRIALDAIDKALINIVQKGLPFCSRPYHVIGLQLGVDEQTVIKHLQRLQQQGAIKRFGVVVRHHELGYRANAMLVLDIPDQEVAQLGHCIGKFEYVTLCYRRPRVPPAWPYNLFCMIHGKDRDAVLIHIEQLIQRCRLEDIDYAILFSKQRFKQRGAIYQRSPAYSATGEA